MLTEILNNFKDRFGCCDGDCDTEGGSGSGSGTPGADGKDGITPRLKIENGY